MMALVVLVLVPVPLPVLVVVVVIVVRYLSVGIDSVSSGRDKIQDFVSG